MKTPNARLWILWIILSFLTACNYPSSEGTLRASPTLLQESTPAPVSTETAAVLPSQTPTQTPTLTLTPPAVLGERLPSGDALTITQIHMLDAANGWSIGRSPADVNDHILFTTDGGAAWSDRTPLAAIGASPPDGLNAEAYFMDALHAWVIFSVAAPQSLDRGQIVWRTEDGGLSWSPGQPLDRQNLMADFFMPSDLQFLDAQRGWVLAHLGVGMSHDYFAVYATQDRGITWERVTDPESQPELMGCGKSGMVFITESDGWLGGNCPGLMPSLFLYHSTDGGSTWNKVRLPVPEGLQGVSTDTLGDRCGIDRFINPARGILRFALLCPNFDTGAPDAWLYTSMDAGVSYSIFPLMPPYNRFEFLDTGEGWRLGTVSDDPNASGEIFHTTDQGAAWDSVRTVAWHGAIDFVEGGFGWVLAQKGDQRALVVSRNGGELWEELQPVVR